MATLAVLEAMLSELRDRLNKTELHNDNQFRVLREANDRHVESDREEFSEVRERVDNLKEDIGELKTMLAERIAVADDIEKLNKDVEELKLTGAGQWPWFAILGELGRLLLAIGIGALAYWIGLQH